MSSPSHPATGANAREHPEPGDTGEPGNTLGVGDGGQPGDASGLGDTGEPGDASGAGDTGEPGDASGAGDAGRPPAGIVGPGGVAEPRARSNGKERILAAALAEIAAGHKMTIGGVAAAAGVSRQSIHYHFRGLQGLRTAVGADGDAAGPDVSTRERLIEAAERRLSAPGGGDASVEAIAAEAGLTKGAFYHYFPDRRALLREVASRVNPVGEIAQALEEARDLPDRDCLIALTQAYYGAVSRRADLIRNLVATAARDPEIGEIVMHEILSRGVPLILGWFRSRMEAGTLRPVDPALVVQALFGPAFLRVMLGREVFDSLSQFGIQPATDRVEGYVDMLLAGIASEPELRRGLQPTSGEGEI